MSEQKNNLPAQTKKVTGLQRITKEVLLREYSIPNVIKSCRSINTTLACISSNMPSIARLKRDVGEDAIQACIEAWIINMIEFVNIGKNMTDMQVYETASMVLFEYTALNLADINLVFKMAKLGKFGTVYDRLDGQIILSWFEKYFQSRCKDAAERSMNEAQKYKSNDNYKFSELAKKYNINK